MYIKFLFLTNAVLTFGTNIPRVSNHRLYEQDRQLSLNSKNDTKLIMRKDNDQLQLQKSKDAESIMDNYMVIRKEENVEPLKISEDTDRIQFRIEGHKGPQTYIFGFDTGYGKNRQFRLEERHEDGTIKGQYGYYDAKGKLRKIQYVARPFEGYTEIHHKSNVQNIEK